MSDTLPFAPSPASRPAGSFRPIEALVQRFVALSTFQLTAGVIVTALVAAEAVGAAVFTKTFGLPFGSVAAPIALTASLVAWPIGYLLARTIERSRMQEREIERRERLLLSAARLAKVGQWRLVLATGELEWSDHVYAMAGTQRTAVKPTMALLYERIHADDRERVAKAVERLVAGTESEVIEYRILGDDAVTRTVWVEGRRELDGRGQLVALYGACQDVSERVDRERELKAMSGHNRLLAAAVEASPSGVVITEATGSVPRITYVNRAFEGMTGYAMAEIAGRSIRVLFGPQTDPNASAALIEAKARGEHAAAEMLNYRKDGSTFWNVMRVAPVADEEGRITNHISVLWDATEKRQRDAEERQRQKLEALGQLAGGIAHEINNLLQPVVTLASLNLKRGDLPADVREDFGDVLSSARQCREIVGAALAFARKEGTATEPLCLAEVVRSALALARGVLPPSIVLDTAIASSPMPALVGRTEVTQVVMNLLTNAADAMNGCGRIEVALEGAGLDGTGMDGNWRLRVQDHGCGMDECQRQRIFEPFFTTKPQGKGTGLGLSVVHGIVRGWNATIAVDSNKGAGTSFTIAIPAVEMAIP